MKVTYPVIFTDVGTNILIEVPDLGILTESNSEGASKAAFADAIIIAKDAITTKCRYFKDEGKETKAPPLICDIDVKKGTFYGEGECIISMVEAEYT